MCTCDGCVGKVQDQQARTIQSLREEKARLERLCKVTDRVSMVGGIGCVLSVAVITVWFAIETAIHLSGWTVSVPYENAIRGGLILTGTAGLAAFCATMFVWNRLGDHIREIEWQIRDVTAANLMISSLVYDRQAEKDRRERRADLRLA